MSLGLGSALTENLGVFAYGTRFRDNLVLRDDSATFGSQDKDRLDIGLRYRFSPTSMSSVCATGPLSDSCTRRWAFETIRRSPCSLVWKAASTAAIVATTTC